VEAIRDTRNHNVSVLGFILPESSLNGTPVSLELTGVNGAGVNGGGLASGSLPVLGTTRQLGEVINRERLDRIILACDSLTGPEFAHCGKVTKRMGVTVSHPILLSDSDAVAKYQTQYGQHFAEQQAAPFTHWQEAVKRAVDVSLSLTLIILLLPIFALLALLVRLTSRGPVFYLSRRVGRGGRYFTFYKFRSMHVEGPDRQLLIKHNEGSDHLFKIRRDPRITPLGRVMRRLSLDELPQLFNVLSGDMSLVGPRPLPAEDLDPDGMSTVFMSWAEERAYVRPGITGLWQIRGRSELPFGRMVELDTEYIRNWTFSLDLRILLQTPRAVLSGRGAY
jgi:lipopolysaccharide/colanic/teichoic acid biosynthesis glycosyltransferase